MTEWVHKKLFGQVVGLLLPFFTCYVQWKFWYLVDPCMWFFFFPASYFSAQLGGFRVGVISTIMSSLLVWTVFITKGNPLNFDAPLQFIPAILFVFMGILFSYYNARLRNAEARDMEVQTTLALTDDLTGLPNRRAFDAHLTREWYRTLRTSTSLSVLMIDVDHFKKYNDSYGHPEGDQCLKKIAKVIQGSMRASDFSARYGGEEFICVMPDTREEGAVVMAERIRKSLEFLSIPHKGSPTSDFVTLSAGVATQIPVEYESFYTLIKAADQALYKAKYGGRNRVEKS